MKNNEIFKIMLFIIYVFTITFFFFILGAEAYMRLKFTYHLLGAGKELSWIRQNSESWKMYEYYVTDSEFGFRPKIGTDRYGDYGTKPNKYTLEKSKDKYRILFIGDSVTVNGILTSEIIKIYGENKFEFWNAGVGSFNTLQEVKWYKNYNYKIKPDHVILTFHYNDYETTPVAFFNNKNKLVVYAPGISLKKLNLWLFQNSYLYRMYTGLKIKKWKSRKYEREKIIQEVRLSLKELKNLLSFQNVAFTVIIHPYYVDSKHWKHSIRERHDLTIEMLQDLKILYFDLSEVIDESIAAGIAPDSLRSDPWHVNQKGAKLFAKYLYRYGLLNIELNEFRH